MRKVHHIYDIYEPKKVEFTFEDNELCMQVLNIMT